MIKVYVDTNIVLDLLARREPFYKDAANLFTLSDRKKIELSVSALTVANTSYILRSRLRMAELTPVIKKLLLLVNVLPLDERIINLALSNAEFTDFEDCLQYYSAIENRQDIIITRDLKDYKNSRIPVMTASQYISTLND